VEQLTALCLHSPWLQWQQQTAFAAKAQGNAINAASTANNSFVTDA
jgi:hypothetical protein